MRSSASSRRRTRADTTVTIPVQATATGAVAANAFTGWTNVAGGAITSVTAFGTTAKYLHANNELAVFARSAAVSFDQEVTFWSARCAVYLRLTDAGAALALVLNTNGSWYVLYVPSVATGTFFDTGTNTLLGSGTPSGINMSDTDGDEWTFGVSGFEVYVKWNGVEQWRGKQIYHHTAGRVGLRTFETGTTYGFRSVSAVFKPSGTLYSSPLENIIDVRDFGLKTLTATGSMSAASTTLTLDSNPGFAIGDPIIVVIGGESGLGEPGTRGVGGQWPTLTYANATARNADTSQAVNKVAAQLDNGLTYQWNGSAWVTFDYQSLGNNLWHYRMLPKSLVTTITNVSGTTLTLADASTVATTGATVVYNNATRYEAEIGYNYTAAGLANYVDGKTISWPAGTWYVGKNNNTFALIGGTSNWTVRGDGRDSTTIVSPMGVTGLKIQEETKSNALVTGLEFEGNRRGDKGWLFLYDGSDVPTQTSPSAFTAQTSTGFSVTACRFVTMEATLSGTTDAVFDDIESQWQVGQRGYGGWQVQISNCTNGTATNIVIDNPVVCPAMEIFGGTGCSFSNVTITNGLVAVNSASNWTISDIAITLETNAANNADYSWFVTTGAALVDINTNISGGGTASTGGVFEDFNIDLGYANAANFLFKAISVSGNNDGTIIRGDYPAKPNTNGLITLPTGWSDAEGRGVYIGGGGPDNIAISGIRVTPTNSGAGPDVFLYAPGSSITNSVVDDISTDQTNTGNITNAAYNAL